MLQLTLFFFIQCHLCDRRTRQASNLRSHYKHFHRNKDITGRQIRQNSRIFSRYSQSEIEQHLREYGDLMVLLEQGLTEYNREQNEKNNEIANALRLATASMTKTKSDSKGNADSASGVNISIVLKYLLLLSHSRFNQAIEIGFHTRKRYTSHRNICVPNFGQKNGKCKKRRNYQNQTMFDYVSEL